MSTAIHIQIDPYKASAFCLLCAVALAAMHSLAMLIWYLDLLPLTDWLYISFFDLDEEEALGTWYSSLILFAAGTLSLLHSRGANNRSIQLGWRILGFGFYLLSLDEIAGFHETVNTLVENTHWTTFGLGLIMLVGLGYLPFLWAQAPRIRYLLIAAGLIYAGGAIGVEWATIWYEDNDQLDTVAYNLWNAVEEFLEMAGIVLYNFVLLREHKGLKISLEV